MLRQRWEPCPNVRALSMLESTSIAVTLLICPPSARGRNLTAKIAMRIPLPARWGILSFFQEMCIVILPTRSVGFARRFLCRGTPNAYAQLSEASGPLLDAAMVCDVYEAPPCSETTAKSNSVAWLRCLVRGDGGCSEPMTLAGEGPVAPNNKPRIAAITGIY